MKEQTANLIACNEKHKKRAKTRKAKPKIESFKIT